MKVVELFSWDGFLVKNGEGKVALNHDCLIKVAEFLMKFTFHIQDIRENLKTMAQKHAMRGSGALLVHMINDYLIKELPDVRDMMCVDEQNKDSIPMFMWDIDSRFKNFANVSIVEYEDDNEYFNISSIFDN